MASSTTYSIPISLKSELEESQLSVYLDQARGLPRIRLVRIVDYTLSNALFRSATAEMVAGHGTGPVAGVGVKSDEVLVDAIDGSEATSRRAISFRHRREHRRAHLITALCVTNSAAPPLAG